VLASTSKTYAGRDICLPGSGLAELARLTQVNIPPRATASHAGYSGRGLLPMLDVVMLVIGLGFFALSVGYAVACDRL
jgi:hypothetical protein